MPSSLTTATSAQKKEGSGFSSKLIHLGGLATMVSGGMLVMTALAHHTLGLVLSARAGYIVYLVGVYVLLVVAVVLVPTGMVGFHVLQRGSYGRIGRVGLWTLVVASMVLGLGIAGYLWPKDSASLWLVSPVGTSGLVVGFILYGIATLQARVLPRWSGIAFIVGLPIAIALVWIRPLFGLGQGASTTSILFGSVWMVLGYVLWARRSESGEHPSRVR